MKKIRKSILDTDSNRESRHTRNTKSYQVLPKTVQEVQTSKKLSASPNNRKKKSKQSQPKLKKLVSPSRYKTSPSPPTHSKYFKRKTLSTKSKINKETAKLTKTPRMSKKLLAKSSKPKPLKSPNTINKPRKARRIALKIPKHEASLPIFQVDLKERIKVLQERLEKTKELFRPETSDKEQAAIIIQRWFRSVRQRSKSESWEDMIQEELTTSDLVEKFKRIVSQRSIDLRTIVPAKSELVGRYKERDLFRALGIDRDRDLDRGIDRDRDIDRDINRDINIDRDIDTDRDIDRDSDKEFVMVKYNRIPMLDLKNIHTSFDSDDKAYEEVSYDESSINLEHNEISSIEDSSNELSEIEESSASHRASENACESELPGFNPVQNQVGSLSDDETEPAPEFVFEDSLEFGYLDKEINFVFSKEISSYLKEITFRIKEKEVDPSIEFVRKCGHLLMKFVRNNSLTYTEVMNSPIYNDPLEKLLVLQTSAIGELLRLPFFEVIIDHGQLDVLIKVFNSENIETRSTYLGMIFDCFNEALNHSRPYSLEGMPFPWSRKTVEMTETNPLFLENTQCLVERWADVKCGRNQDSGIGLNKMIRLDVYCNDEGWRNYEDEEAQVCFDIGDLIAEYVVDEVVDILSH